MEKKKNKKGKIKSKIKFKALQAKPWENSLRQKALQAKLKKPVASESTGKKTGKSTVKLEASTAVNSAGTPSVKTTAEIQVPEKLVEQIIGQDNAVELIRKAATQKRNVLLIGKPGTGKSMIAQAMAELLPLSQLHDVLVYPNKSDPNNPKIRIVKAGEGKKIVEDLQADAKAQEANTRMLSFFLTIGWFLLTYFIWKLGWIPDVVYAATLIGGFFLLVVFALGTQIKTREGSTVPKLLIDNAGRKIAPFFEATGARAGALLGDVRHDPLQSIVESSLVISQNGVEKKISFEKLWKQMAKKYSELVEKHDKGYEAIVLPKDEEVYALGFKDKKIVKSRIYSLNRRPFDGEVVQISSGKSKITLTPEHKVITERADKSASKISGKDFLISLSG